MTGIKQGLDLDSTSYEKMTIQNDSSDQGIQFYTKANLV